VSHIRHIITADGNEIVEVYIGPEHEPFGLCYECEDGYHKDCVGVPCECPCPIPPARAAEAGQP